MWQHLYAPLNWDTHRHLWPNHAFSQFVTTRRFRWHVQVMGRGPAVLMLHGTGASAHTWAGLSELLSQHFTLVCPDLPGHAFTTSHLDEDFSMQGMANALPELLSALSLTPQAVIGHSAGAAVGMAYVLAHTAPEARLPLVGLNPAWLPLPGVAQWLFPPAAKLAAINPLSGWLVAKQANEARVMQLLESTGSHLTNEQVQRYVVLMQSAHHVQGVLRMMSQWHLNHVLQRYAQLNQPVLIQAGTHDRTISFSLAETAQQQLPQCEIARLEGLGHLAHEENAALSAAQLVPWLSSRMAR